MANQYDFNPPSSNSVVFNFDTDVVYQALGFASNAEIIQMVDGVVETLFIDYANVNDSYVNANKYINKIVDNVSLSDKSYVSPLLKFTDTLNISDDFKINGLFNTLFKDCVSTHDNSNIKSRLLLVLKEEVDLTDNSSVNGLIIQRLFDKVKIQDYLIDEKITDINNGDDYSDTYFMNFKLQAFTRYKGLSFTSAVKHDGKYLISNKDGIFENDGNVDDLIPISSSFKTGLLRFGGSTQARIDRAFLAVKNDGNMKIKVIGSDGLEFTYKLEQTSTTIKEKRVEFGKGRGDGMARKCTYFQFEIDNDGSTDFELDNLQVYKLIASNKTN